MFEFEKDVKIEINFNELEKNEDAPKATLFIVDENNKVLDKQDFSDQKSIVLEKKFLNKADRLLLTRSSKKLDETTLASAQALTRKQVMQLAINEQSIDLSRRQWLSWLPLFKTCVEGRVQKCFWWPLIQQLQSSNIPVLQKLSPSISPRLSLISEASRKFVFNPAVEFVNPIFRRCNPVCDGIVEVYERICCKKIIITPPIVDRICDILKERLIEIPDIPIPIDPEIFSPRQPDLPTIPTEFRPFFKEGAIDEISINAASDLEALANLSLNEAEEYILARPYLIQIIEDCGEPVLKGATALGEGGEFSFCYSSLPILINTGLNQCRREVAFKVIQQTETGPRVIYNGLAAGKWFSPSDDNIVLTTYDAKAVACDHSTPVPGPDGAYVALARIGTGTDSVHLDSPDQNSAYGVAGPFTPIAGLAFPEANLNLAKGKKKNLNWGGSLALRIDFSKEMAATDAEYYRISIARANAMGQPIGMRTYLDDAVTWYYNDPELVGGSFTVKKKAFTLTDSANPTFHKIPYDKLIPSDAAWRDNQYHGFVDTADFENARYLVTIEVYDSAFNRVVPNGTGVAGDVDESFSYETWNNVSNTTTVSHPALTHLFWWDNRVLTTRIEDLRKDGIASSAECQFLQKTPGASDALFSAGFRAYHPQHGLAVPDFILNWKLQWKRGLGGAEGTLDQGDESVGSGVAPAVSATESFNTMLGANTKCTFSLMLFAAAKTWNGSTYIYPNSLRDVASFALDVSESA